MEPGRLRRESDIVQAALQRDLGSIPINIIFTLLQSVQTGSGSHPASYSTGNGGCAPGMKRLKREANQCTQC